MKLYHRILTVVIVTTAHHMLCGMPAHIRYHFNNEGVDGCEGAHRRAGEFRSSHNAKANSD